MSPASQNIFAVLFLTLTSLSTAPHAHGQAVQDTLGVDIEGRGVDSQTGAPVRYALVQILDLDLHAISDEEGLTRFPNLPLGDYSIMVTKLGYEATVGNLLVERTGFFRVSLVPTDDAVAAAPGRVGGRITDRDTGRPVSGVEVSLPGLQHVRITGSRGSFRFEDVPPGLHVLTAEHLGYGAGLVATIDIEL